MRIAILLLCHKNPKQINLFIEYMQHEVIDIFIHVDKKANIIGELIKKENVYILPDKERISVGWASISQIKATHNLIMFAREKDDYDYYWLCSGQDFPLKTCKDIVDFFSKKEDVNFINLFNSRHNNLGKNNNYDKRNSIYYFDFLMGKGKWKSIIRRLYVTISGGYNYTFPWLQRKYSNFKFYFGSQWWCINKKTMNWIIEYEKSNKEYMKYFSHCSTPDESYYHTLVMNSPYASNREDYLHYIIWPSGEASPKVLTMEDKNLLINSNRFMARKFDLDVDATIIEMLIDNSKEC